MTKGGMRVGKGGQAQGGGVFGNRFGIREGTHTDKWKEVFYKQRRDSEMSKLTTFKKCVFQYY